MNATTSAPARQRKPRSKPQRFVRLLVSPAVDGTGVIRLTVAKKADDYFLNNAVHLLDDFLKQAQPPYGGRIEFAPRQGHTAGWGQTRIMQEMATNHH